MGEIADMMLDGTMCQGCGVWMDGGNDGPGHPQTCESCKREARRANAPAVMDRKVACPTCGKKVKAVGLNDHRRDAHGFGVGKTASEGK